MGWFIESFISFILANNGLEVLDPPAWRIPCLQGWELDSWKRFAVWSHAVCLTICNEYHLCNKNCTGRVLRLECRAGLSAGCPCPVRSRVTHGSSSCIPLGVKYFSPSINQRCVCIQQCPKIKWILASFLEQRFLSCGMSALGSSHPFGNYRRLEEFSSCYPPWGSQPREHFSPSPMSAYSTRSFLQIPWEVQIKPGLRKCTVCLLWQSVHNRY